MAGSVSGAGAVVAPSPKTVLPGAGVAPTHCSRTRRLISAPPCQPEWHCRRIQRLAAGVELSRPPKTAVVSELRLRRCIRWQRLQPVAIIGQVLLNNCATRPLFLSPSASYNKWSIQPGTGSAVQRPWSTDSSAGNSANADVFAVCSYYSSVSGFEIIVTEPAVSVNMTLK